MIRLDKNRPQLLNKLKLIHRENTGCWLIWISLKRWRWGNTRKLPCKGNILPFFPLCQQETRKRLTKGCRDWALNTSTRGRRGWLTRRKITGCNSRNRENYFRTHTKAHRRQRRCANDSSIYKTDYASFKYLRREDTWWNNVVLHRNCTTTRWCKSAERRVDTVPTFHGALKATRFTLLIDIVDSAVTLIPQAVTPLAA